MIFDQFVGNLLDRCIKGLDLELMSELFLGSRGAILDHDGRREIEQPQFEGHIVVGTDLHKND